MNRNARRLLAVLCLPFAATLAGCASAPALTVPDAPAALRPPADQKLSHEVLAAGTQIYECAPMKDAPDRFEWSFRAPKADLFDRAGKPLGTHGAGPFWAAADGSRIVGEVKARDPGTDPNAIPWLLLATRSTGGPGSYADVKSVQRLETKGGKAPTQACTRDNLKQEVGVPYTATYYFYR